MAQLVFTSPFRSDSTSDSGGAPEDYPKWRRRCLQSSKARARVVWGAGVCNSSAVEAFGSEQDKSLVSFCTIC